MDFHLNNRRRRRSNQIRLLEKQLRPEILERCLQFLDIVINQIIYQENIYPSNLFEPIQIYHTLVYQCTDKDISSYITLCIASLRDLFSQQLSDMISINIIRNNRIPIILRRYLIELHMIYDPCLRAIYDNTKQLIHQLNQIFAECIQIIKQIKPLENQQFNKGWTFQLRTSPNGRNDKGITVGEIFRQKPIYKEFILLNQQSDLLSNGKHSKISSIKSLHTERVQLQFMCENDQYEQDIFHQYLINNQQDSSDNETDTDIDDDDDDQQDNSFLSLTSNKNQSNDSDLWPLTSVNNLPLCTINEEEEEDIEINNEEKKKKRKTRTNLDSDLLINRYHSTQKFHREHLLDEDIQPQSPDSPVDNWREEEEEEDEDL